MGQGEVLDGVDILRLDTWRATPGGMGAGGAQPHQVGAQAVDAGGETALGDPVQGAVIQGDGGEAFAGVLATAREGLLRGVPLGDETLRVSVEGQAAAQDFGALGRLRLAVEGDLEAEAVQQLRAQLAFLGVHGADQHEARGVAMGQAVALHQVDAAGGDVQQQVHQVVGQQVHLVDIEHATVGLGQDAGGELRTAFAQGRVEVEGADDAFLAGAQGQGDEDALRQQVGDAPGQGGLGHAARAFDQHTADGRVDGCQVQRELQLVGGDHGAQGEVGSSDMTGS